MKLLHSGKVKDIYEYENDQSLLMFHFSDRVSAFDVKMKTPIPRKGEVLCKFGEFWFNSLQPDNHMVKTIDKDKMLVKKMKMIPLECIVRGYYYGSLVERYNKGIAPALPVGFEPVMAARLPRPIFDPTTKSEEHDRPVTKKDVIESGLLTQKDYNFLEATSISLYNDISKIVERAGFIIADVKFEFGRDKEGKIILADSLGPDEFRLWIKSDYAPGKIQESYDKQLLRDWLIKTGFKQKVDELALEGKKPESPALPQDIVNELARRYVYAYEKITGKSL